MSFIRIFLVLTTLSFFFVSSTHARDFTSWLAHLKNEARDSGISSQTLHVAFQGISGPDPKIIKLDRAQPEGTITFPTYRKRILSDTRIRTGRRMMRKHKKILNEISQKYGVAPQYIVALWGTETNYGSFTGGTDVIRALTTLAYDGRRSEFFRKELMAALLILEQGHVEKRNFKGSWAGALGQCQFMPHNFHTLAVDYDGDGHKDIWNTLPDVFASIANYLSTRGWVDGYRWGREVIVPPDFNMAHEGRDKKKPMLFWKRIGVIQANRTPLPDANIMAGIVMPDGKGGPAFLVYDNYDVLMDWNRSTYFASSVGLLANAISIN